MEIEYSCRLFVCVSNGCAHAPTHLHLELHVDYVDDEEWFAVVGQAIRSREGAELVSRAVTRAEEQYAPSLERLALDPLLSTLPGMASDEERCELEALEANGKLMPALWHDGCRQIF